jgi:hypothetical protein
MALTGYININVALTETKTGDLGTGSFPVTRTYTWTLGSSGVGANQADLVFSDSRSLAAGANENLDLNALLVGAFGTTVNMVKLKALLIAAAAGNTVDLTVGRGATNGVPWLSAVSSGVIVRPGGVQCWAAPDLAGIGVVAATADLINVAAAAGSGSQAYDVVIVGTSA